MHTPSKSRAGRSRRSPWCCGKGEAGNTHSHGVGQQWSGLVSQRTCSVCSSESRPSSWHWLECSSCERSRERSAPQPVAAASGCCSRRARSTAAARRLPVSILVDPIVDPFEPVLLALLQRLQALLQTLPHASAQRLVALSALASNSTAVASSLCIRRLLRRLRPLIPHKMRVIALESP